jgi:hypothetical protein
MFIKANSMLCAEVSETATVTDVVAAAAYPHTHGGQGAAARALAG